MRKDVKAVLDASAILAILQEEPGADALRPVLPRSLVSSVNIAEVLAKLVRDGMPLREAVAAMAALHLEEVPFDAADAQRSAAYVAKGISLGDRCFLATLGRFGEGYTSDREIAYGSPTLPGFARSGSSPLAPRLEARRAVVPAAVYGSRARSYHRHSTGLVPYSKLFPCLLLACNLGAAVCCAVAGDYRRSVYWAASALCIGAITF